MTQEAIDEALSHTLKHIELVQEFGLIIARKFTNRCCFHDASKISDEEETEGFAGYTAKLNGCAYGSPEEIAYREELKPIRAIHHSKNRHHPEHFENGVSGMNLIDLLEMVVDWKAAGQRHAGGCDFQEGLKLNLERYGITGQLADILLNSINIFEETKWQKEKS